MKHSNLKQSTQENLREEIMGFVRGRKSLQLSTVDAHGKPYASYAPFAIGSDCLYVLLSEIAIHAVNLQVSPDASVLIIEDEDAAGELFARVRVNYSVLAAHLPVDSEEWKQGITILSERHGERINNLSSLADFHLFKLQPKGGRYVKGFGRAYDIEGETLGNGVINHLRDGHKKRDVA